MSHRHQHIEQGLKDFEALQCYIVQSAQNCHKMGQEYQILLKKYHKLKRKYRKLYYSPNPGPGYQKARRRFNQKKLNKK